MTKSKPDQMSKARALVEKYRRKARAEMGSVCCGDCNDMRRSLRRRADEYQAIADTITALLAENERLQMQIKSLDHALDFIVLDAAWTPKHPACESIITRINALRKGADDDH